MRPPICELCRGKAASTVAFADHAPPPDGAVGHPRGLGWFCWRHRGAARRLMGRSQAEALGILRRRRRTYRVVALSVLVGLSATVAIRGHYPGPPAWLVYVFKPLTTALVFGLAARPRGRAVTGYRTPILVGLAFSLLGDVFLMLPGDLFLAGLASFAVTHVFYLAAFRTDVRLAPRILPFLFLGGVAAVLLVVLWPGLAPVEKAPVVLYAALLAAMTAQATGRAAALGGPSAWVAAAGALVFLGSDATLALDRFRFPFEAARAVVLSSYFLAQWLIALSVQFYHSESPARRATAGRSS